jgi:hypothetical protein
MKLGFDYSLWISPIDGKILSSSNLPGLGRNYVWEGMRDGEARATPGLIDIKLDLINLRNSVRGDYLSKDLPRDELFIGNDSGVATHRKEVGLGNLPSLGGALFPLPGGIPLSVLMPNPTFNPLSGFDWIMSGPWLPQVYVGSPGVLGVARETVISSSLAMTQIRASQIMKRFDNANFIVGSNTVDFGWENPAMLAIPEVVRQLYGLSTSYTFTKAQSLGALGTGLLKNTVNNDSGTLSMAESGEDYVNTSSIIIGNMVIMDPRYPARGSKLIAPTLNLEMREKTASEFTAYPIEVPAVMPIFDAFAATIHYLNIPELGESLIKTNNDGDFIKAKDGDDYISPELFGYFLSNNDSYKNLVVSVANILGSTVFKKPDHSIDEGATSFEVSVMSSSNRLDTASVVIAGAAVVIAGVLLFPEVAGVAACSSVLWVAGLLFGLLNKDTDERILTESQINYGYGVLLKGKFLNSSLNWKSADLADYGYLCCPYIDEVKGTLMFKLCDKPFMNFDIRDRGNGTLWFDSFGRSIDPDFSQSESGLRLFSWDSHGDGIANDEDLSPLHIGLFGYNAPLNYDKPVDYAGFILRSEFQNDSRDISYRQPINFGLYFAKKRFYAESPKSGFKEPLEAIFEYDRYTHIFSFKKNIRIPVTDNIVPFMEDVLFLHQVQVTT